MSAHSSPAQAGRVPICVDLDGTLITGDLLWESFVELFRRSPVRALFVALTVFSGKAVFKQRVAEAVAVNPDGLPYRVQLLEELRELKRQGAYLVLATASHETYARVVSEHLGIFDEVIASDGRRNLSGRRKADALVERFGASGFDYLGNDWADVPVWQASATATIVAGPPALVQQLTSGRRDTRVVEPRRRGFLPALVAAMRPHQWAKNSLVFVPIIAGHQLLRVEALALALMTFVAFSLCASAIYILNDISDVRADRQHARKERRPFAAGELSIPVGVSFAAALLAVSASLAAFGVAWRLAAILGLYVIVTSAYTLRLKRVPVVDVFTLTGLYVLRIVAGGVATGTTLTTWLLAFALFFFLGLAFVKRYTEVIGTKGQLPGREYGPEDAMWMHAVGTSASYMAVVVLALYVNTPEVAQLYDKPDTLWLLSPVLLFWLTRLWFRAGRQLVHDDPVVEALRDPLGYVAALVMGLVLLAAAVGW